MSIVPTGGVTAVEAFRRVWGASLHELVGAFDPRSKHDPIWFTCPRCQQDDWQDARPFRAHLKEGDEIFWRCSGCGHRGTVFELARLVLEDGDALRRLLELTGPAQ